MFNNDGAILNFGSGKAVEPSGKEQFCSVFPLKHQPTATIEV